MAISQQKFRELVFLILYCQDLVKDKDSNTTQLLMEQLTITKKNVFEAEMRADLIKKRLDEIDDLISKTSLSYDFERIQLIERNILRLGIYELLFDDAVPPKVAISESVRLVKKFGTPSATAFVNAILDKLYKNSLGEQSDEKAFLKTLEELKESEEISKNLSASDE